jgi:hypothetical protein
MVVLSFIFLLIGTIFLSCCRINKVAFEMFINLIDAYAVHVVLLWYTFHTCLYGLIIIQ